MGMSKFLASVVLTGLALVVAFVPAFPAWISGFSRLGQPDPTELDVPFAIDDAESPRLLAERNRVRVVVPREMTVGFFLQLYQISNDHVRRQIAKQLGRETVGDGYVLRAGQVLELELTPVGEER